MIELSSNINMDFYKLSSTEFPFLKKLKKSFKKFTCTIRQKKFPGTKQELLFYPNAAQPPLICFSPKEKINRKNTFFTFFSSQEVHFFK